ncbi:MAG: hypothetical protein Q8S54_11635 [Bacteroidota bacterium]|nr:hypothetical protein [Odoribacter sp.]MDP3643827.1 hypothetical protein [Bacteroidota bacterium]
MKIRIMLFFLIMISGLFSKMYALPSFSKEYKQNDSIADDNGKKKVNFHIRPSLGLTFSDSNADGERTTNLQWLGTLNSDFDYIGKKFDFSSTLFMQYGESKITGQDAEKLQDAFILSITPSIPLIKVPVIRLFLETTAETNMGKGTIDDMPTSFLDPLFLYQTLFLGQKHYSYQNKDNTTWELTYGLGYAFQQTLNKKFEIQNDISGGKSDFESGFSGIIEFNVNSQISESLSFVLNAKAVALSRENFFQDFDASRRSILVRSGLFYKKVGMEYNYHQVHDLNLSENDLVDQSIMFTISF